MSFFRLSISLGRLEISFNSVITGLKRIRSSLLQEKFSSTIPGSSDWSTPVAISKKLFFNYNKSNATVLLDDSKLCPVNQWVSTRFGVLRFIPNNQYLPIPSERKFYFQLIDIDLVAKEVSSKLKVSATNKLSSIINLQYIGNRPKLAEDVLNEIIVAYKNIELKEKGTNNQIEPTGVFGIPGSKDLLITNTSTAGLVQGVFLRITVGRQPPLAA